MLSSTSVRIVSIVVGVILASVGAFGAIEFAKKLEGGITYIVVAAPVIAGVAALIPAIAETTWHAGYKIKSVCWWLVLIPAAATVYFAVAERVHHAKAGLVAERVAYAAAADRARATLQAKAKESEAAKAKADETRGWRRCGPTCEGIRATAERLEREEAEARRALLAAEKAVHAEASIQAHPALFPAAMYLVEFMAFWTGLSGPVPKRKKAKKQGARRASRWSSWLTRRKPRAARKRTKAPRKAPAAKRPAVVPANDNIVPFPPAA